MSTSAAASEKIVVELIHNKQRMEYSEVTLAEAKEILSRKMNPGWHWTVPLWQFDNQGGMPVCEQMQLQEEAYRKIEAAQ